MTELGPANDLRTAATTLRETGESPEICEPLADLLDEIAAEAALQEPDAPTGLTLHLDTALAVARAVTDFRQQLEEAHELTTTAGDHDADPTTRRTA